MNEPLLGAQKQNKTDSPSKMNDNKSYRKAALLVYLKAFLSTYSPKFLVLLVFTLSVVLQNIIGMFLLMIVLLAMILDVKTHWNKCWVAIIVAVVLILACQITFLFPSITNPLDADLPNWIGVGVTTGSRLAVFGWGVGLLIACILVALSQRWSGYVISQQEFYELEERLKEVRREIERSKTSGENLPNGENQEIDKTSAAYQEYLRLKPQYNAKKVLITFRSIYHRHGYEWSLFIMLIAAFSRLNIISVLYVVFATALSFCSHFFNSREEPWLKRLGILRRVWRFIYIIFSLDAVRQYFFIIWFPPSWKISKPLSNETFSCSLDASASDFQICQSNYRGWLSLDSFSPGGLTANFISLFFMISYDNYFYPLKEESERTYREGDENDFTVKTKTGVVDTLKFLVFCYSYKIFLGIFVVCGIMGNVTGKQADIISLAYVLIGIVLLYKSTAVMKRKNQIWKFLEIFNCAVLIAFLIYEAPIFECPINASLTGHSYFTNQDCLNLQGNVTIASSPPPHTFEQLIPVIGLNKTTGSFVLGSSKMRSLILFFLFGVVQRKIWNHVYMTIYVEPYLRKDILFRESRGIHYIEKAHIKRIGLFRNLVFKRSLLKVTEEEVDRKVRLWEQITTGKSIPEIKETSVNEDLPSSIDPRYIECLHKISPQLADSAIIMYDDLIQFMIECDFDPKATLERVELETQAIEHQLKLDLHSIPEIGLPPVRAQSLTNSAFEERKRLERAGKVRSMEYKAHSPKSINLEFLPTQRFGANESTSPLVQKENEPTIVDIKKDKIDPEQNAKKLSWREKLIYHIKVYLLKQIKESFSLDEDAQALDQQTSSVYLGFYYLLIIWPGISCALIVLCFVLSPSLITFFLTLGVFCYAAVEYPVPGKHYWIVTMWYLIIALLAKFIIQLPFFCGGISYGIRLYFDGKACPYRANAATLDKIDEFIGLRKFTNGMLNGVIMDFITLISLLICRFTLQKRGIWDHVALTLDKVYVPQFKQAHMNTSASLIPQGRCSWFKRVKYIIGNFSWNLFPYNTTNQEVTQYNSVKKPGKDYYNASTMIGIVILIFLIIFYTDMDGSGLTITESFQQSSFSGGMVIAVTITIILILLDRILYVTKEDFLSENLRLEHKTFWKLFKLSSGRKVIFHYLVTLFALIYTLVKLIFAVGTPSVPYISVFFGLASVYLYNSAAQVKYGYPLLSKTHTFDSPDYFTALLYKIFKSIPFLSELRSILDWTVSTTALDLYQWMKVEDAWTYLYYKEIDNQGKRERRFGEARKSFEKCTMGWLLVVLILLLIIGPLILFSSLNPSTDLNNLYTGSITLSLMAGNTSNAIYPIFSVNNLLITGISNYTFNNNTLKYFPSLGKSDQKRIQTVQISNFPDTSWEISPPSLKKLINDLNVSSISFYANLDWQLTRPQPLGKETVLGSNAIYLDQDQRTHLVQVLTENSTSNSIILQNLFPNYLTVSASSPVTFTNTTGRNYSFTSNGILTYNNEDDAKYWELYNANSTPSTETLDDSSSQVWIYAINEMLQGSFFGTNFGNLGVITIYVTFVLAIGRIIRGLFDRTSQRVIYEEMPEPRDLRELIEAISSARLEKKLEKEHRLYELLIRILRSPEVIMKITGRVQKYADEPEEQPQKIGVSTNDIPNNNAGGDESILVNPDTNRKEQEQINLNNPMLISLRKTKSDEESNEARVGSALMKIMEKKLSTLTRKGKDLRNSNIELSERAKEEEEESKGKGSQ